MNRSSIYLVLVVAAATAMLAGCGGGKAKAAAAAAAKAKKAAEPRVISVTAQPVELRSVQRKIAVVGTLNGLETLQINSKVPGRIAEINADLGDRVQPGNVIARIDPSNYQLAVDEAQRGLERDLAKLGLTEPPGDRFDAAKLPSVMRGQLLTDNARRRFERARTLLERKASSLQEFEQSETDLRVEEATLRQTMLDVQATLAAIRYSQSLLATAKRQLAETEVVAPPLTLTALDQTPNATYVVAERLMTAGEFTSGIGKPMFELVVDDALKLKATVPERYAAEVKVGQPVDLEVDAYPSEVFRATIARVSPTINSQSRTFEIEAIVPNADHRLQHGGFAKAGVLTREAAQAVTVPPESLVTFAGVTKVFLMEDGKVRDVPVSLGLRGDGWVEIVGDIDATSNVVTSGQTQLAAGSQVAVRQPAVAAPGAFEAPAEIAPVTHETAQR